MALITIDPTKCNHDGLCVQACPAFIITMEKGGLPETVAGTESRCIGCGHCVAVCPTGALDNALTPRKDFLPVPGDRPGADQVEGLLLARRSVRGFKKEPVPREQLERLLEVARRAPTASNSQQVSWTMVQAPQTLVRIRKLTEGWMATIPRLEHYAEAERNGVDAVLRGAPALAVAHSPKEYLWADTDSAIALTYMELLAASMGLGACWGGLATSAANNVPELAELLHIPEGHKVCGALMLGVPRQKHLLVPPRNPAKAAWL